VNQHRLHAHHRAPLPRGIALRSSGISLRANASAVVATSGRRAGAYKQVLAATSVNISTKTCWQRQHRIAP